MPSERIQRRIDALLDEADAAVAAREWAAVAESARAVLAIDEGNEDAAAFLKMAASNDILVDAEAAEAPAPLASAQPTVPSPPPPAAPQLPESFGAGRFHVQRSLARAARRGSTSPATPSSAEMSRFP